uniref:Sulfatase-modifying factor enzyme 1 n=1 Tax=Candidatus Kentrum sp. LFY TaxID=2126342 RepID=A0A450V3A7_9GAMM|nr:MAG: Sulfatase-modifying factor enzyme 1 [Candidatus Kentron sp. LFY]
MLWEAVMSNNPSRFKSPDRPVERVSWKDAQEFLAVINGRMPGLDLSLPSEAQWEYACRAGTMTALYNDPMEIIGVNNVSGLDTIAWYGGNSGVDFELENGKRGTHPVGRKEPNPWGLYDMLGNVWEWTQDQWHNDYRDAPTDGTPWENSDSGTGRVLRGGSWGNYARYVRAACRNHVEPGLRYNVYLGFRCVRVHS